jgi:hypothetical protein
MLREDDTSIATLFFSSWRLCLLLLFRDFLLSVPVLPFFLSCPSTIPGYTQLFHPFFIIGQDPVPICILTQSHSSPTNIPYHRAFVLTILATWEVLNWHISSLSSLHFLQISAKLTMISKHLCYENYTIPNIYHLNFLLRTYSHWIYIHLLNFVCLTTSSPYTYSSPTLLFDLSDSCSLKSRSLPYCSLKCTCSWGRR